MCICIVFSEFCIINTKNPNTKKLKEREEELNGEVRLFLQQAEEIGQGAKIFIKEGALEGVEEILGAHVLPI